LAILAVADHELAGDLGIVEDTISILVDTKFEDADSGGTLTYGCRACKPPDGRAVDV
jgi:hypothetical protein